MTRDLRRLTTIVSVDVVGYSRLMGFEESATLAALKAHLQELVDPKISEFLGRTVKSMGDGLLLEFPSVVDAVRCAVDIQRGMAERNMGVPAELRIQFRVGINVGDIIIEGEDIFGDGVNIAARLQTLADAGGICVSRAVRDQVLGKLNYTFEELGAREVKNIARPVEVYRVEFGETANHAPSALRRWLRDVRRIQWRRAAAGLLALGLVAVVVWVALPLFRMNAPAPTPPALSIAVLPFTAPGGTSEDGQLADGLTRDLTAALGEWRFATVAPFRSASVYTGKTSDVQVVGRKLNVRYLAEGEIHRAGEEMVVRAQIIDTSTGNQVWSERVATQGGTQDRTELVRQLNGRLRDALLKVESHRAGAGIVRDGTPAELVLRAGRLENTASDPLAGALEAGKLYQEAIRMDPALATALVARINNLDNLIYLSRPSRVERDRMASEMDELSRRAIAIDDRYPAAWYARALTLYWQGRLEEALEANAQYLRLDSSHAAPLTQRAWLMLANGRAGEALDLINEALSRPIANSYEASFAQGTRCAIDMRLGRYQEAVADCQKALAGQDWDFANALLMAAYAQQGDLGNATKVRERLAIKRPGYTVANERAFQVSSNQIYLEQTERHFFAGLRKAGVPEN